MKRERLRFCVLAGAALAAGLLLRLWFVTHLAVVAGDSLIYGGIAKNWLLHGVYGYNLSAAASGPIQVLPTTIRLPGYPLFLALCFRLFGMEHYHAVMYVQVAVDLLTCWLASTLAGRLFGKRAALVVLWMAALCPFTANYVAIPLTETLVLASIATTLYGFARWQEAGLGFNRWLWLVAAALAASILLRPEQGLFAAAVVPPMLWTSIRASGRSGHTLLAALPALAVALCALFPLVPWTVRNWRTFHIVQPLVPKYANDPGELSPIGFGRWYRTWAFEFASNEDVYWPYYGDTIQFDDLPNRAFRLGTDADSDSLHTRTRALIRDYNANPIGTPQIDARFGALAAERIHAHPVLYYIGLPIARLLDMTLRPRTEMMDIPAEWWRWHDDPKDFAFAATYAALNLAYIAAGSAGFVAWRRCRWLSVSRQRYGALAFAMAASLLLRAILLLTLDNSEPRYTLEFFPVLLVWAGAFFASTPQPATAEERGGR